MENSHSFQSEHSPRGAEASFAMGVVGEGGGFTLERGKCDAGQDIFIGFFRDDTIISLPYTTHGKNAIDTGMAEFIPTGDPEAEKYPPLPITFIPENKIQRRFGLATDSWHTDEIEFSLYTPVSGIPDPESSNTSSVKDAICPAIVGRLTLKNKSTTSPMRGFFAMGGLPHFVQLDTQTGGELAGVQTVDYYGFATIKHDTIEPFSDMFMDFPFRRPQPIRNFQTGIGGFLIDVPAGKTVSVPIAFGWYRPGIVTLGKQCSYYYTNYFANLTDVLQYALSKENDWIREAEKWDSWLSESELNDARRFLYAKSVRSYYGSTQLLSEGGRPRWIVNEGSCNMANTLDLTIDMAFFEAKNHPWLLKNVLDSYADEYSYNAGVHFPEDTKSYPGGVSFTHDQGTRNAFAPHGQSHYEAKDHPACFSFMTHEELLNWVLCAAIYVKSSNDTEWLHKRVGLIIDCLVSMQNRDNPEPDKRNGMMGLDCDYCGTQSEITTYDSLDPSLGQARNNSYMGVKCWAAYLTIAWLMDREKASKWNDIIVAAKHSAQLAATTIVEAFDTTVGYIPAILENDDTSAIIPVIEALVYPKYLGIDDAVSFDGPFAEMLSTLKKHLSSVLQVGKCLFPDGGWKLSGNNDNSWMSKIFICQNVAETILGFQQDERADGAHEHWWRVGCAKQSVVDQVVSGTSGGSGSIYPRCVSCVLWVE